jgi:hypothetical protein
MKSLLHGLVVMLFTLGGVLGVLGVFAVVLVV